MSVLRRYELERQGDQRFGNLSGGQQARFQILLLELQGSTALLLDEPTDNLDLESTEALQEGLESYEGTVLAVTHDRWFARTFDRFLVFGSDGIVRETSSRSGTRPGSGAPASRPAARLRRETAEAMADGSHLLSHGNCIGQRGISGAGGASGAAGPPGACCRGDRHRRPPSSRSARQ